MAITTWSNEYIKQADFVRNLDSILTNVEKASIPASVFSETTPDEAAIIAAWQAKFGSDLTPPIGAALHQLSEDGNSLYSTFRRFGLQDGLTHPLNFHSILPKRPVTQQVIYKTKLEAAVASLIINLPAYEGALSVNVLARGTGAVGALDLTINGVVGANYNLQAMEFTAAGITAYQNTSLATLRVNNAVASGTATPIGAFNFVSYFFPSADKDLSNFSFFHGVLIDGILMNQPAAPAYVTTQKVIVKAGGILEGNEPISTITLASSVGNLAIGTEVVVYAINPAVR